jgi:hypothetical protein
VNRVARCLLAACLVVGPLAGVIVRASIPGSSTDSLSQAIAAYASHPGATQVLVVADGFMVLMVPASLAALALAWRRAPVVSLVAAVLSFVGWSAIVMLAAQDAVFAEAGRTVYQHAQATELAIHWSHRNLVRDYVNLFVAGHLFGTILLGVALWRARAIPRWAAAMIGVSMPVHLAAFITGVRVVDVCAFCLLLVGFAVCARQVAFEGSAPAVDGASSMAGASAR